VIKFESSKIKKPWHQIKLGNIDKNLFANPIDQIVKKKTKKLEIYYDLFDLISYRVDLIDKNLFNLPLNLENGSNSMNLIRLKNAFLIKVIKTFHRKFGLLIYF
jgi:hypothetical protein